MRRNRAGGVTRRTVPLVLVLTELDLADRELCGVDVMALTGLPAGTTYPLLGRLVVDGLAKERADGTRVYLTITDRGRHEATAARRWAIHELCLLEARRAALARIIARMGHGQAPAERRS